MTQKLGYQISKWITLLAILVLFIWDVIAMGWIGLSGTISTFVWRANEAYPMLAVIMGFVLGHLVSGSAKYSGIEKVALTPLRLTSLILSAGLVVVQIISIALEPKGFTQTIQSAEYAFVRATIGLMFGRWFWGGPVSTSQD